MSTTPFRTIPPCSSRQNRRNRARSTWFSDGTCGDRRNIGHRRRRGASIEYAVTCPATAASAVFDEPRDRDFPFVICAIRAALRSKGRFEPSGEAYQRIRRGWWCSWPGELNCGWFLSRAALRACFQSLLVHVPGRGERERGEPPRAHSHETTSSSLSSSCGTTRASHSSFQSSASLKGLRSSRATPRPYSGAPP